MNKPGKEERETLLMVSELWRRRLEYLWEKHEYGKLDIEKLDDEIIEWEKQIEECRRSGKERGEEMRQWAK